MPIPFVPPYPNVDPYASVEPGYTPEPEPSPQQTASNIFSRIGNMVGGAGAGGAYPNMPAPSPNPWGVAPSLPATYAPPPLPQTGQPWYASSATGAPLTPNNTGIPYPAIPPSTNYGNPQSAQWQAQMNVINARQGHLGARRAYEAALPAKWTAEGNTLDARQRALTAQSGYLSEQARANAERLAAQQRITAARNDPNNAIAVARGQRERQQTDYTYRLAGLPTPIEIDLPDNFQGDLPPGVRQRIESIADKLTRQETDADKIRQFNLEAARIKTAQIGQEVTAADIASGRVSLSLEQLEQAVRLAGFDVDQSELAAVATKLPPAPGLTWDAEGNQWVNEVDLDKIRKRREVATGGDFGPLSIDQMMALLNGDKMSPEQFRSAIKKKYGYLDSTVEYLLQLAALRKQAVGGNPLDNPDLAGGALPAPPARRWLN